MTFFDWRYLFNEIFQDYPDNWRLNYVHRNESHRIQDLRNCRQMGREKFAFFFCKRCSNQWASAKAQVILYYPDENQPLGKVTMQIFGQQCRKCIRKNGAYVDPLFDLNTITEILEKLHERIGCDCYNKRRSRKNKNNKKDDEPCDIKGEHESNLCEACKLGICTFQRRTHR